MHSFAAVAPEQYASGTAYFRHLALRCDVRALIPRPETEVVVDVALRLTGDLEGGTAIDVGTGSGCIAISLATEGAFDRVIATDISLDALALARQNVEAFRKSCRASVELRHGSLLGPVAGERARLIVSNPPYIAAHEMAELPGSVRDWEPPVALLSDGEGMATGLRLAGGAWRVLAPGGWLVMEADSRRAGRLAAELTAIGRYEMISVHKDLTGRDRVVSARLKGMETN